MHQVGMGQGRQVGAALRNLLIGLPPVREVARACKARCGQQQSQSSYCRHVLLTLIVTTAALPHFCVCRANMALFDEAARAGVDHFVLVATFEGREARDCSNLSRCAVLFENAQWVWCGPRHECCSVGAASSAAATHGPVLS